MNLTAVPTYNGVWDTLFRGDPEKEKKLSHVSCTTGRYRVSRVGGHESGAGPCLGIAREDAPQQGNVHRRAVRLLSWFHHWWTRRGCRNAGCTRSSAHDARQDDSILVYAHRTHKVRRVCAMSSGTRRASVRERNSPASSNTFPQVARHQVSPTERNHRVPVEQRGETFRTRLSGSAVEDFELAR